MRYPTDAACREHDPELFFPLQTGDLPYAPLARPQDAHAPRAVCAGCPVRRACLTAALDEGAGYGMRGGTLPAERAALTRAA